MNGTFRHQAFGWILSSPLRLPAPIASDHLPVDVTIELEPIRPLPRSGAAVEISRMFQIEFASDCWILHARGFDATERYSMRITPSRIFVGWTPGVVPSDVARHVIGPALAAHASLVGRVCLHGCAVRTTAGAVLLLGESGRGKSTLTAALVAAGAPLITEEYLMIAENTFSVVPGIPALKVSEPVAAMFDLADRAHPTFRHPDFADHDVTVSLGAHMFAHGEPVAIDAIYLLDPRHADASPRVSVPLPVAVAAASVAEHGYWAASLPQPLRERLLRRTLDLARISPVRRLALPNDLSALPLAISEIHALDGVTQ